MSTPTIHLPTPTDNKHGLFSFAYSKYNWIITASNIFEYKQLTDIIHELNMTIVDFNPNLFTIQVYGHPFNLLTILRQLPAIKITKGNS